MKTIKIGAMPGKLQEVEIAQGTTAREALEKAGLSYSNHEVRLDGEVIDLDTDISNGRLCVIMKQIKGNSDVYVTTLEEDEIEYLLDERLPQVLNFEDVEIDQLYATIQGKYIVDKEMFFSVYEMGYDTGSTFAIEEFTQEPVQEEHVCECKNAVNVIERRIEAINEDLEYYDRMKSKLWSKLEELESVLKEIQ